MLCCGPCQITKCLKGRIFLYLFLYSVPYTVLPLISLSKCNLNESLNPSPNLLFLALFSATSLSCTLSSLSVSLLAVPGNQHFDFFHFSLTYSWTFFFCPFSSWHYPVNFSAHVLPLTQTHDNQPMTQTHESLVDFVSHFGHFYPLTTFFFQW